MYKRIKVLPRSKQNEVVGEMDDGTLKVRIKAAPEKGKANKELIGFLASHYGVGRDDVEIVGGKTDQIKLIKINGRD